MEYEESRREKLAEDLRARLQSDVADKFPTPIFVISGTPGVGKSHTIAQIIQRAIDDGSKLIISAPAGSGKTTVALSLYHELERRFPSAAARTVQECSGSSSRAEARRIMAVFIEQSLALLDGLGLVIACSAQSEALVLLRRALGLSVAVAPTHPPGRKVACSPRQPRGPRRPHANHVSACEVAAV